MESNLIRSSEKLLLSAEMVCTPEAAFAYASAIHVTKKCSGKCSSVAVVLRGRAGGPGVQSQRGRFWEAKSRDGGCREAPW